MAKYDGWTYGETEALLNKIGGVDVARAVLRGEKNLVVKDGLSTIGGVVLVKTLHLKPSKVRSNREAIFLGSYDDYNTDIVKMFFEDGIGFDEPVNINLVRFDRKLDYSKMIAWAKENGVKPMQVKHLFAIGIQFPYEQLSTMIVEIGTSVRGDALCLHGSEDRRCLSRYTVGGSWAPSHLFGFLA